jgi:hypothetical protein
MASRLLALHFWECAIGRDLLSNHMQPTVLRSLVCVRQERAYAVVWNPQLASQYRRLYPPGQFGPTRSDWRAVALRLREQCQQYAISDRMPRPIIPGDKRTLNKRVVEALAGQIYRMELQGESSRRVWAYRRAAWAVEDTPQDLGLIYNRMGVKGLEGIENVGPKLAQVVEALIRQWA